MTDGLDIAPIIVWVAALSTLLSFSTAVWTLLTSGARKNDKRIADLTERAEMSERRLTRLEDQVTDLPNNATFHRLELSLTRMEGHIDRLDERLKPVAAIPDRMQELMLHEASKGR